MKARFALLGLLLTSSLSFAQEPANAGRPQGANDSSPGEVSFTIGSFQAPDKDCRFRLSGSSLTIEVPGSETPHDFAPELKVYNAPRWLSTATGDFKIQAKVGGKFLPGDQSTLSGRAGYTGAGLIIIAGTESCITLARATLQHEGEDPYGYINFEMRLNGELIRMGQVQDRPVRDDAPVYLRLERRGNQVLGAVSENGSDWEELQPKTLPENWPATVDAGLVAISTSKQPFSPVFSEIRRFPQGPNPQPGMNVTSTQQRGQPAAAFSGRMVFHQKSGQLTYDLSVANGVVTGTQHFGDLASPTAQVVGGWFDLDQGTLSLLIQGSAATEAKWRSQAQQFRVDVKSKQVTLEHALYGFGLTKENSPVYADHTLDTLDRVEHLAGQE